MFMILDENKVKKLTEKIRITPQWASYFLGKFPRYFDYVFKTKEDFFEIIKINAECCCKLFLVFEKQGLFSKGNHQNNDYELFYKFIFDKGIFVDEQNIFTDDFYNYVKANLFDYFSSWQWLNDNNRCETLIKILTMKTPDLDICKIIINHYNNMFNSYFFLERLKYSFAKSFNREIINIANANNISIPRQLDSILKGNC